MSVLDKLQRMLKRTADTPTTVTPAANTRAGRNAIAKDTLARVNDIVTSTPGASLTSEFVREADFPPLVHDDPGRPWPNHPPSPVRIVNSDSYLLARNVLKEAPDAKVSVLNLASSILPGGGWVSTLSLTQEEALCYSSTLYPTFDPKVYPWRETHPTGACGIYSPAIVVFKDDLEHDCADLPVDQRVVVSVLTFAAPCGPRLTPDGERFANQADLEALQATIRLILRTAARRGQDTLVLGAIGCGAYMNPPKLVAQEMLNILRDDEYKGWFRRIEFAVYSKKQAGFIGADNFDIFSDVFKDVVV